MYVLKKSPVLSLSEEAYLRNPLLTSFGAINMLGFLILMVFSFFDERTLLGINVWIKPMKFFISVAIFAWTMGWFLHYLPQVNKAKIISVGIVCVFTVEMAIVTGQAAMGKTSHFNISTIFDAVLFQTMGIAIVINTLLVCFALFLFLKPLDLPKGYLWGIRLGLLIFILASLEGFAMVENAGHTVGAQDGVEGWFFLNWAKQYGDLRIAHFLGLHALQAIPLFAWFYSREKLKSVFIFAAIYALLAVATFLKALAGIPLISM